MNGEKPKNYNVTCMEPGAQDSVMNKDMVPSSLMKLVRLMPEVSGGGVLNVKDGPQRPVRDH